VTFDLPSDRWIDLAISNGLVWAISQNRNESRLIAFDGTTGELRHDLPIAPDANAVPVRLVADERNVVVGIDTSGGGGRTGELRIVDPVTAEITDTVPLPSRPEGIVLTARHIWTSAEVLDRATLAIEHSSLFGTITRGPDGSIWGTTHLPGAATPRFVVTRTAPGDVAG